MERKPVLIIAGKEQETFYRALPLWEERIEFHPLQETFSFLPYPDPDLLLIDSGFDHHRGLALLEQLKRERADVPVILLADTANDATTAAAYRLGARRYLQKPIGLFELKEAVEELLMIKRSSRESRTPLLADRKNPVTLPSGAMGNDTPENLMRAVLLMESSLSSPLTVEMLAKEAGLSKFHFCRVFKKAAGVSPMALLSRLRIERAKELLKKGKPVSLTCLEVGFSDISSFIRHFKKAACCTPGAYQSSLRERPKAGT